MQIPKIKEITTSIVLLGHFNPQIFQPEWFRINKLIGDKEGENANVEVIHPDVSIFNCGWLRFEVTRQRVVASSKDARYFEILRDLVLGTFHLLSHTPVKACGINITTIYGVETEVVWHDIGNKLAPKTIWDKLVDKPGLKMLELETAPKEVNGIKNVLKIKISPEPSIKDIKIHINHHYEILQPTDDVGCATIVKTIHDQWTAVEQEDSSIKEGFFKNL